MLKLTIKFSLLVLTIIAIIVVWQQAQLSALVLSRINPVPKVKEMLLKERYAEASDYLDFFMGFEYVNTDPKAQALHAEIASKRESWNYKISKLGEGLLSGTSDETIGQTAAVISDFFVIGDIRDLTYQGFNMARGEEVDEVIASLAALGIIASTAQVASSAGTLATGGGGAPTLVGSTMAKSSLVTLKTARKVGKLPSWLNKAVIQSAKKNKSLDSIIPILSDVNTLTKTRGGFTLLQQTNNAAELRLMANFAKKFEVHSATIYRIGGKTAVNLSQQTKRISKNTIKIATTFGKSGLKMLDKVGAFKFTKLISRATKITYKGDILKLIIKLLLSIPRWVLYLIITLGLITWTPRKLTKNIFPKTLKCEK